MKLRYRFYATDPTGAALTGMTFRFKPHYNHAVAADAVEIVPTGGTVAVGEYQVTFDPAISTDLIARSYDIYLYDGATEILIYSDRILGKWEWVIFGNNAPGSEQLYIAAGDTTAVIPYSTLVDSFGESLPRAIPNPVPQVISCKTDRMCYISAFDQNEITLTASAAGAFDEAYCDVIVTVHR